MQTLGVDVLSIPIYSFVDSKNLQLAITSKTLVTDKWLRVDIALIQKAALEHKVNVRWIEGLNMISDC